MIDRVDVDQKRSQKQGYTSEDSEHDYEFVIGNGSARTIRKVDLDKIVKVQALVRGFISRMWDNMSRIIYNKILTIDGVMFKFVLRKHVSPKQYSLSAIGIVSPHKCK